MTISASVLTIAQNKTFSVTFPKDKFAWIGIVQRGGTLSDANYGYGYFYVHDETEHPLAVFTIGEGNPQPALVGETDLIGFTDNGYTIGERSQGPTILPFQPSITLSLAKPSIKLGEAVTANWSASDVTDGCWDALALVPSGQDVDKFLGIGVGTDPTKQGYWQLTKYQKSGTMSLRPPKGKFSVGQTLDLCYVVCGSPVASKKRELHRVTGALKLA